MVFTSYSKMTAHFSIANFAHPDGYDAGSLVTKSATSLGANVDIITSSPSEIFSSFNHGIINWKGILQNKQWLINSATTVLDGESPYYAWAASMIIGELEGVKTVMVVDIPKEIDRLSEMWGAIIDRICQIHILFITTQSLKSISELEDISIDSLLSEIRFRGLIPFVCNYDEDNKHARVEHSRGSIQVHTAEQITYSTWLANFLHRLPLTSLDNAGIEHAASCFENF